MGSATHVDAATWAFGGSPLGPRSACWVAIIITALTIIRVIITVLASFRLGGRVHGPSSPSPPALGSAAGST
eukprot:3803046-Pyramimonas_sp.AAC.1